MDLRIKRIKLWPGEGKSSITAAAYGGTLAARARPLFSWGVLAAALLGVTLARWTWLLLAPAGAAMPPAAWEASDDAGRVFGTAAAPAAAATAALGNIKLIGVFANRTKGFAIMQVDDKQIGVAQGDDVKPGLRLAETHADYVVLDQGGVSQRVDLTGAAPAPSPAVPSHATPPGGPTGLVPTPPQPDAAGNLAPGNAMSMQRPELQRPEPQRMGAGR